MSSNKNILNNKSNSLKIVNKLREAVKPLTEAQNLIKSNNVSRTNVTNATNATNATNVTNSNKKFKFSDITPTMYIIAISSLILLIIIIYLIVCYIKFSKMVCYVKKDFFEYIFDFSNTDICEVEKEPVPLKPIELEPHHKNLLLDFIDKKEVFHIENQNYTYAQAKCKCEAYGGDLATKNQMIDAYNNGASWCSYGWTDGQNAYYPVSQCFWDEMQKKNQRLPDHQKKFCGIPSLNGGHFSNPELKFGINCYGIKPKGELNKAKKPYCPPMNFCKLEENHEASTKLSNDSIAGFNEDQWNM